LISAYNEQDVVGAKATNCQQIDYPPDRLEFLFGLDAPTDKTPDILCQVSDKQIRILHYKTRRGKVAVLCDLAKQTSAEILVLTDANTMLDAHCIKNLVRHFADSGVGAVSGEEIRVVAPNAEPSGESLYWRYESALKILESRLNCSLGGNGAVLAIRRSLFKPFKGSIVEDFQLPLEIRFNGARVVYDPEAIAVEEITPTSSAQFARRVRIGAGNYQTLFTHPEYLNPLRGLLGFSFISHRLLRWLAPFLLLMAFFCSMAMVTRPPFGVLLTLQCLFYCLALLAYLISKRGRSPGMLGAPLHFCSMNLALFLGFYKYITGRQGVVWRATPRRTLSETTRTYPAQASIAIAEAVERHPAA
jgi:cellulose synthase/poly-beta-1,6-N-acetylglucosamine synthase-like glycosyltransferase